MANQKKLNRWMDQLEALLNEGTREYRTLDALLNSATAEIAAIKRAKNDAAILRDAPRAQLDSHEYCWRYCSGQHSGARNDQRL